jgi:hypothetical protein
LGVERVAGDVRYRVGIILVVVFFFSTYLLITLHSLRADVDAYIMPRTFTSKQSGELQDYLSSRESSAVTVIAVSADQEALDYAAQIYEALRHTNWDVNPPSHSGPNISPDTSFVGVFVRVDVIGQPSNPDPRHPTADAVLCKALSEANVPYHVGYGFSQSKNEISLIVGHRPMIVRRGNSMLPIALKVSQWIRDLAR